jgi:restriction system protein
VKFKLNPNSGFAVLLRSPWWVSFAIVAAIAAGCFALLPAHMAPFVALGATPIALVGCIAAWRQWRAPSAARVQGALQAAAAMPWRDFAAALERAWRAEGHAVQRLEGPQADLRIDQKDGQCVLVSARRYKAASHGVQPLQALHEQVQRQGARAGVYVVLQGTVSDNARAFAREKSLALLEGDALAALLLKPAPDASA